MISNRLRIGTVMAVALALATGAGAAPNRPEPEAGVYQYVVHKAQGTLADIAAAIAECTA